MATHGSKGRKPQRKKMKYFGPGNPRCGEGRKDKKKEKKRNKRK